MKSVLFAAVLALTATANADANYLCNDGLSAQYNVFVNEEDMLAGVTPTGENQGEEITNVSSLDLRNPQVIGIEFTEGDVRRKISIGRDGVSTISEVKAGTLREIYCEQR